ncbi:MAG TPA: hypothetical protein VII66_05640 [Gemmatimonadaceae bacterium]|jgi:hypothetical protein
MDLLTNAIESIQVGVEDWQTGSRRRLLSSVRNIHAGILLLFKEALLRRSPAGSNEVLIKARIQPVIDQTSGVKFRGVGRNTVGARQIRERFDGLGIEADWKKVDEISEIRNDIEHYFADVTRDGLSELMASAFVIIRAFCVDELQEDPHALLGKGAWDVMLKAKEVYEAERAICQEAMARIAWESPALERGVSGLRCSECASNLFSVQSGNTYDDTIIVCRSCGKTMDADEYIPAALDDALGWEAYEALKDGGDSPLAECPTCGLETYVMEEVRCARCGESAEHTCSVCGSSILPEEMGSSPLCGWCRHMGSKDD